MLVLDLNMPGGSSLEAIPRLLTQAPATAIVVLTMQDDPAFARQALRAGALGYVLKEAAAEELLAAIRLAAAGGTYLNPGLAARLAARPSPSSADSRSPMPAPIIAAYDPFLKDHAPVELALAAAELTGADVIVASVRRDALRRRVGRPLRGRRRRRRRSSRR